MLGDKDGAPPQHDATPVDGASVADGGVSHGQLDALESNASSGSQSDVLFEDTRLNEVIRQTWTR